MAVCAPTASQMNLRCESRCACANTKPRMKRVYQTTKHSLFVTTSLS